MTYYNILCEINKSICKNSEIRKNTEQFFKIIDTEIKKTLYNSNNNDELIYNAMKVAALIKLYQPFYDGNHRTALIIFGNLLTEKGLEFDYQTALHDMKNNNLNIPTIYDQNDKIGNFSNWYKYINYTIQNEKGLR